MGNIFKKLKYLSPLVHGEHQQINKGERDWENMYRDRWSFDIANAPDKMKLYKSARGMGGFVRSNWDEVSELVAASVLLW